VTSLDTDQWGNLYAAAPNRSVVRKFAPDLTPLADLKSDLSARAASVCRSSPSATIARAR